jgi:nitrate reductase gamma subunit
MERMNIVEVTRVIAIVGFGVCVLGIAARLRTIMNRPFKPDLARAKGSAGRGVLYAFMLGMAPWKKESTRLHWLAYIRGILFHVGTFVALAALFVSPWLEALPDWLRIAAALVTGFGAIFGFAGIVMRRTEENLRVLSVPDDYASVALTSLFTALGSVTLMVPDMLPIFYLVAAMLLIYLPFSKIRHCVYFFYSKFFYGRGFGYRGVIGQPRSPYSD